MTPIQVSRFGPMAFEWVPKNIAVVRDPKKTGCRCNGKGSLGTIVTDAGANLEARRDIPCPCLHITIPEGKAGALELEINEHYEQVAKDGTLCPCMWCEKRRSLMARDVVPS